MYYSHKLWKSTKKTLDITKDSYDLYKATTIIEFLKILGATTSIYERTDPNRFKPEKEVFNLISDAVVKNISAGSESFVEDGLREMAIEIYNRHNIDPHIVGWLKHYLEKKESQKIICDRQNSIFQTCQMMLD